MYNFFDVVKINEYIEDEEEYLYFKNVKIENVKRNINNGTLNFYLFSNDIIPYYVMTNMKNKIADFILGDGKNAGINGNIKNDKDSDFINLNVRYKLSNVWNIKKIFETIKNDLRSEIKEESLFLLSVYDDTEFFVDDSDNLLIKFDSSTALLSYENRIVEIIKKNFHNKFGIDLNIDIEYIEKIKKKNTENCEENNKLENSEISNETKPDDEIKNENTELKNDTEVQNEIENKKTTNKSKYSSAFLTDENILYGKRTRKNKFTLYSIKDIIMPLENIKVKGFIFNYYIKDIKNNLSIYTININDGAGSIPIKIFASTDDKKIFIEQFAVGTVIEVSGKVEDDKYDGMCIRPTLIEKVGQRAAVEYGSVGDDDYYNVIITDREDLEKDKRVELHLHTKSSAKDAIGDVNAYIDTAIKFGMSAMAITDHGVVNSLADAYEHLSKLKKKNKDGGLKIINGVEGYLVEDFEKYYYDKNGVETDAPFKFNGSFVLYDVIATGNNKKNDAVLKIVATKIENFVEVDNFSMFIHTDKALTFNVKLATNIENDADIINAKNIDVVLKEFCDFAYGSTLVSISKNTIWQINDLFNKYNIENDLNTIDLITIARLTLPSLNTNNLLSVAKELKIKIDGITTKKKDEKKKVLSVNDKLKLSSEIIKCLFERIKENYDIDDLSKLNSVLVVDNNFIKRQKSYHIILLAKNDVGRVNLYKIVSDSHIDYMYKDRPRIPKSLLMRYREGIIVGSACIQGELMDAIKNGSSDDEIKNIASFYDYLEIQPSSNNAFLLEKDPENFKSFDDLNNLSKKVVEIGDILKKPVVATCDCHYIEKEDRIYREILKFGSWFKKSNIDKNGTIKDSAKDTEDDVSDKEELYFRTTGEMLSEFSFLGVDKAYEVVVKNTNLINDMIEDIIPLRCDKCPPFIEGSDDELKKACYNNLSIYYGDDVIAPIKDRLNEELSYIIDNGYSVMYITAKKLIDFSKENGYPVGSRGSVGSSFAATMSGVSDVNPLPPHYVCPNCHHIEYETEETKKYENESGFDMPDKICPICKSNMNKDGVNIPFETFLGIPGKANKEPDIDLNFASVFQSNIHKKTTEIFGKENTFKAGTVGTVAVKTAYGYVKKFIDNKNLDYKKSDIDFAKGKIVGCKNNTSQHPGGMVVVPKGEYIYTFTPINIAANKEGSDITTHYDYHKIDENLLKLDILGHETPLLLKKLSVLTGVDYNSIPFYESDVLKLFESTESLGINPNDISGTRLGCLTIPEFGTDFAMGMCEAAKPKTVADLIRISGLAHGTNVWQGNIEELIKNDVCTLKNAICCRDDIMLYLISMGLNEGLSFKIMESVRKGRGLNEDFIKEMKEHNVPDWYIECCMKIKYLFPKAHAAAYVLASLRIAYYKVHYKKEYYAAYFSVRKNGLDYKLIMQPKNKISFEIEKIKRIINAKKKNDATFAKELENEETYVSDDIEKNIAISTDNDNEESIVDVNYELMSAKNLHDLYMCYRVIEEMKARGIDFCPIDIYKAKRSDFIPIENENLIMPSFDSIQGIGTKDVDVDYAENTKWNERSTAMRCELEGHKGIYTSIKNFIDRTGVNKTRILEMKKMGLFNGLKDNDDSTLLDYLGG